MQPKQKTYMAKVTEVERKCYLVDAKDKILGRVAVKIANILRGKHKATYTPHTDTGDMVIVINADKIKVTGNKMKEKEYQRFSLYHSGQRRVTLENLLKKAPTKVLDIAVKGMLPHGTLGVKMRKKLRLYAGDQHPHLAQKPIVLSV